MKASPHALLLALFLTLTLASCGAREPRRDTVAADATPARMVSLEVGGMVCGSCVDKVQSQLAAVPGVRTVRVSLQDQRASVTCDRDVADSSLTAAVRRAGPDYVALVIR
jgi:Cu+-exporting ATPase